MDNNLQRSKEISIKGNTYTITFPTLRQFLRIESLRMSLSNGAYSQMLRSLLISSDRAITMIDMVATMTTLCPDIMKDMKVNDLLDLDVMDAKEMLHEYEKNVMPWIDSWMKIINDINKQEPTS